MNSSISGPTCSATRLVGDDLHAARLARRLGHGAARLLGEPEDLARQRGEPPPAGGQRDAAAVAHEQLVAQLPAQRGDGHGHGRLGDLELRGRRLDRAVPGDEDERLELGEGHVAMT